ncbi:MAG TPA: histidinol-phosphate transaminase [Candidatus Acidoferrales bacterium]|nr:histidinol-phosphate transaminase [Candidatus Acidoferrales bacterium]
MTRYLRPNIARLKAYVPGEQPQDPGVIKLNTNENPYPPSPRVLSALRRATNFSLRLYPEPMGDRLRAQAASVYGVEPENVLAGNGSDELLSMIARCFVGPGDRVAYPVPTYTLYDTLVAIQEGESVCVEYPADFSVPEALAARPAALTFLCNPNSPSATLVPLAAVERLARSVAGVLVVDEAYIDFAAAEAASALPLVANSPNLIVLRSFSKSFSLAGMRIGLAFGPRELIAAMAKVKDSYNLNRLSLEAATAALQDLAWMRRNVARIQRTRARLAAALEKLGFYVYPSHANFILARWRGESARPIYERLKERKILVRYFDAPGLEDALRITIGTPQETKRLVTALHAIVTELRSERAARSRASPATFSRLPRA